MRFAVASIVHETNTYAPKTELEEFYVFRGEDLARRAEGTRTFEAGALAGIVDAGAEAIPVYLAEAQPSGVISAAAYDAMKEQLLSDLAAVMPCDGVVLTLHGAGIAEGVDDLEADLLRAVRQAVGEKVPITVSLDLHGNITQEMADLAQAMFGDHDYPHTDMFERGHEAAALLPRLVSGELRPVTHVERIPMLLPPTQTIDGPMNEVKELCLALEKDPRVVDVTFFHGFPFTDVPIASASVVVTTDGDRDLARELARRVASHVWDRRSEFLPKSLGAAEAVTQALQLSQEGWPVVINETSDNSGGGTPGDGTHLLRAMLEARVEDACFGYICDPAVVEQARKAGPGATIEVSLGGKTDKLHGEPIKTTAYVKTLSDGRFRLSHWATGMRMDHGPMARLQIDGIDVLVGSLRSQVFDAEVFALHGIDVMKRRIVALKSSQHFRAGFQHLAKAIVTADPPGLTTLHIEVFERTRTPRPIWPLDPETTYP